MIAWIAAASCSLASVPAALFLRNLALYAPPPATRSSPASMLGADSRAQ